MYICICITWIFLILPVVSRVYNMIHLYNAEEVVQYLYKPQDEYESEQLVGFEEGFVSVRLSEEIGF